jgi:hypothetical protein
VLVSVRVKALTDRDGVSELYQRSGNHGFPYGLHYSLCTLRHACSMRVLKVIIIIGRFLAVDGCLRGFAYSKSAIFSKTHDHSFFYEKPF